MRPKRGFKMAKIDVDNSFCKGCGLCASSCPKNIIELDMQRINEKGYHPAHCIDDTRCIGCAMCATMCPDAAITVWR